MLTAIAKNLSASLYAVLKGDTVVAVLETGWATEPGELRVMGRSYRIGRVDGVLCLTSGEGLVVEALKKNPLRQNFEVSTAEQTWSLEAEGLLRPALVLRQGAEEVGRLRRLGWTRRRFAIDLPERLELHLRLFLAWLAILQWKHASYLESARHSRTGSAAESDVVLLARAQDPIEAALWKARFEAEGLAIHLTGGLAGGAFGELPRDAMNVELWVNRDSLERARDLLRRIDEERRLAVESAADDRP